MTYYVLVGVAFAGLALLLNLPSILALLRRLRRRVRRKLQDHQGGE